MAKSQGVLSPVPITEFMRRKAMAVAKAWEAGKSEGTLVSLQPKQVVWATPVKPGLEWPLHHPKTASAPRRAAEVWEKLHHYPECGREDGGLMYNFLSSESNIVINKLGEATCRRTTHECLSFLRRWKLRGIQIASFPLGYDTQVTCPKLTIVGWHKGPCKVT